MGTSVVPSRVMHCEVQQMRSKVLFHPPYLHKLTNFLVSLPRFAINPDSVCHNNCCIPYIHTLKIAARKCLCCTFPNHNIPGPCSVAVGVSHAEIITYLNMYTRYKTGHTYGACVGVFWSYPGRWLKQLLSLLICFFFFSWSQRWRAQQWEQVWCVKKSCQLVSCISIEVTSLTPVWCNAFQVCGSCKELKNVTS